MYTVILCIVFFALGWLGHTLAIVWQLYKLRANSLQLPEPEPVVTTREALLEKIDDGYFAYNNANYAFMSQSTNLEELIYKILGEDDNIRLIVEDNELKKEVIALLSQPKQDTVPSSSPEHLDTHQA